MTRKLYFIFFAFGLIAKTQACSSEACTTEEQTTPTKRPSQTFIYSEEWSLVPILINPSELGDSKIPCKFTDSTDALKYLKARGIGVITHYGSSADPNAFVRFFCFNKAGYFEKPLKSSRFEMESSRKDSIKYVANIVHMLRKKKKKPGRNSK